MGAGLAGVHHERLGDELEVEGPCIVILMSRSSTPRYAISRAVVPVVSLLRIQAPSAYTTIKRELPL